MKSFNKILDRFLKFKTIFFVLILLFNIFNLVAQEDSYVPVKNNFIPPSPNASSLGMYGEIPVSYYTGTPSINIPIYELKGKQLSVPISLSYHASGIKVDQQSGIAGLGWALNAGGVITRTIKSLPDEWTFGYNDSQIYEKIEAFQNGTISPEDMNLLQNGSASGRFDTEPDVYYYNFMGRSGKLVFSENEAFLIPHANYEVSGNVNSGFTIIIEDGTKFEFKDIENSTVTPPEDDPDDITGNTAWYLSKITSTSGEEVNFSYIPGSDSYMLGLSENRQFIKKAICAPDPPNGESENSFCGGEKTTRSKSHYRANTKLISQISNATTSVSFNYSNESSIQAVHDIKIFDKNDILTPKKEFELTYGTFGARRPKLSAVTEKSGNLSKPPHQFIYNATALPPIGSTEQDHWGYYNHNRATTLIPTQVLPNFYPNQLQTNLVWKGADRASNNTYGQAGILTEINYPTGGKTVFEYESHDYGYVKNHEVNEEELNAEPSYVTAFANTIGTSVTSEPIIIEKAQIVKLRIYVTLQNLSEDSESIIGVSLSGINKNYGYYSFNSTRNLSDEIYLEPGTYHIQIEIDEEGEGAEAEVNTNCEYYELSGQILNSLPAGGVRVKKIINYDDITSSTPSTSRGFMYTENNRSSGVLSVEPNYGNYYSSRTIPFPGTSGTCTCNYYHIVSNNQSALGQTQGSHVGYKRVIEYLDRGYNWPQNGWTEYYYTSAYEYPDHIITQPPVNTSYDYKRGLLAKKVIIGGEMDEQEYFKVKEIINEYTFDESVKKEVDALNFGFKYYHCNDQYCSLNEFFEGFYKHISQWVYLSKTTEISYTKNEEPVYKVIDYVYGNSNHLQPTSISTTNSDGKTQTVKLKYAHELDLNLLNKHMESQVLEAVTDVDGSVTKKEKNVYDFKGDNLVPVNYILYPTGNDEQIVVTYDYDSFGNITEVKKQDEIATSYIWGYNNQFPIAKITGKAYSEIPQSIKTELESHTFTGSTDYNGIKTDRDYLFTILSELIDNPTCMLTYYTYAPLAGMTSQTDPSGKTIYYQYDVFGRLETVKDPDGFVLNHYEYQYVIPEDTESEDPEPEDMVFEGISGTSTCNLGEMESFSSNYSGGSGSFSFFWVIQKNGTTIATSNTESLNHTFKTSGSHIIFCTITDNTTHSSLTKSKTFYVNPILAKLAISGPSEVFAPASGTAVDYLLTNTEPNNYIDAQITPYAANDWVTYEVDGSALKVTFENPSSDQSITIKVRKWLDGVASEWAEITVFVLKNN